MSGAVLELEPLLYYLQEHANGSWAQFVRAVKNFHPDESPFSIARGLSEHGLVEFFWDGGKNNWSVTTATAVVCNRPGGRIALWGGTHRSALPLVRTGIPCQIEARRMVRLDTTYTYLHAVAIDVSSPSTLSQFVPVVNSRDVLENLPSLEALLLRCPTCEPPSTNASTYRYSYHFAGSSTDDPSPFVAESPSLWRVGRKRFIFVRDGVLRQVPDWLGKWLLYAAERRETWAAMFVQEGEILTLPFAPLLPPPYARALLFSGAAEIVPTQFGTRCFANVPQQLALSICSLLSIEPEIKERRIRDIA